MKKRLMAVLLCVCMAAVLLTPYASVLTARGALTLGFAGADGSLTEGGDDVTLPEEAAKPEENQEQSEATEPTATPEPTAEPTAATAEPEATEATATTAPEATKAPVPEYTLDSNGAVYKDGKTLRGDPQDYVVKAQWQALAYKNPTDSTQAKTTRRARACACATRSDEIEYEDCDGIKWKWSVVLDGNDFYFVLSQALELAPAQEETKTEVKSLGSFANIVNPGQHY